MLSKKPEDKKVTLNGETTVFECQATGNPMPKIIWLKHHLPLQLDQGLSLVYLSLSALSIQKTN